MDIDGPVALQICTVDHSSYEGRIGVGRLSSGTLHEKEQVLVVKPDGAERRAQIRKVYTLSLIHIYRGSSEEPLVKPSARASNLNFVLRAAFGELRKGIGRCRGGQQACGNETRAVHQRPLCPRVH